MHYLLIYEVVDDYVSLRTPFRQEHLQRAHEAAGRGELLLGGALADPVDRAILLFRSETSAREFAARDPYVSNGLIARWSVRPWTTVAGAWIDQE